MLTTDFTDLTDFTSRDEMVVLEEGIFPGVIASEAKQPLLAQSQAGPQIQIASLRSQ